MAMSNDSAQERRLSYRRMSASAPVALPPTDHDNDADDGKLYAARAGSSSGSDRTSPRCSRTPPQNRTEHTATSTEGRNKKKRHRDYSKSLSLDASCEQEVASHRRTVSSSSSSSSTMELLTKVKEQIVNHVFQPAERPHAALLQDRRQRAVDAFEAKRESSAEYVHIQEMLGRKSKQQRAHSAVHGGDTETDIEMARLGFRRRSISEETYNRPPQTIDGRPSETTEDRKGVVCSNEDLKSILVNYQQRRQFTHTKRPASRYRRAYSWSAQPSQSFQELSAEETDSADTSVGADHKSAAFPLVEGGDEKPSPKVVCEHRRVSKMASLPEVTYDEYGQTWDVYGAEFDPEVLGDAIVKHLEKLMARKHEDVLWGVPPNPTGAGRQENSSDMLMRWLCFYAGRR